ncbi:MAG: molybdopterin-dependent oxidoreductase, partial [Proteobacteria bacterium]|nr:molybdopterin-dependent oxidoreductase [Pseudomonadota bacterium]
MNARIPEAAASLDRRQFVTAMGGLTLGLTLGGKAEAAAATAVNAWLTIGSDGSITLASGASDMGQGSFSGLAQILCEDLMVDPGQVKVVPAAPSLASPAPVGVAINTVGSSVTRNNFWRLRDAGAIA